MQLVPAQQAGRSKYVFGSVQAILSLHVMCHHSIMI